MRNKNLGKSITYCISANDMDMTFNTMTHTKASTTLTVPPSIKEERALARARAQKLAFIEHTLKYTFERGSTTLTAPPSIKEKRACALKHAQEAKRARRSTL